MAGFAYIFRGYGITPVRGMNPERYAAQHFLLD